MEDDYTDQTDGAEGAQEASDGTQDYAVTPAYAAMDKQIQDTLGVLRNAADALRVKRVGPSNAEKWFAIAAALGKPTKTGSFGEGLSNVNEALADYNKARREAEIEKEALLQRYGVQDIQLQGQRMSNAIRLKQAANAAAKAALPKSVVDIGGVPSEPDTGQPVIAPSPKAYADLEANPTEANYNAMVSHYPRFANAFRQAYMRGVAKLSGGMR